MKQSTLTFSASKRTNSSISIGKAKVSNANSSVKPLRTSQGVSTLTKADSSDDEIDDYDDIVLREETEDEIEDEHDLVKRDEAPEKPPLTDEKEIPSTQTRALNTPKTRSQTKKAASSAKKSSITEEKGAVTTGAASPGVFKQSNLKPEDLAKKVEANEIEKDGLPELNVKSPKWNKQYGAAKAKMGHMPTIHGEKENKIHEILRVFDDTYEYGPCIGMTRLERWERAEGLGLDPPKEIYEILKTKQGMTQDDYKESVFHGQV